MTLDRATRPWRTRRQLLAVVGVSAALALTGSVADARVIPPVQSTPGDSYISPEPLVLLSPWVAPVGYLVLPAGTYLVNVTATFSSPVYRTPSCSWLLSPGSTLVTPIELGSVTVDANTSRPVAFQTAVTIQPQVGAFVGAVGLNCRSGTDVRVTNVVASALRTQTINVQVGP